MLFVRRILGNGISVPPYIFSVSATKKVSFSPGNLQYQGSTNSFRFAEHQWDVIGNAAGNTTSKSQRPTQSAWIDLFGWGTSGWNNGNYFYRPYDNSNSTSSPYTQATGYGYGPTDGTSYYISLTGDYANSDWGVYNAIYNPNTESTDPAGTWRTLTSTEWIYVLTMRTTKSGVSYARATVNGICGLIIVPDNWRTSTYALNDTNLEDSVFTSNIISANDWNGILEKAGCIFLPTTGYRYTSTVTGVDSFGCYWSSTSELEYTGSYYLAFQDGYLLPEYGTWRRYGMAVRLVRDYTPS